MTKTIRTNKWLRAALAVVVLLGVLLCAFPVLHSKAAEEWAVTVNMGEGAAYNDGYVGSVEKGQELNIRIPNLKMNPLPNGKMFSGVFTGPNGTGEQLMGYHIVEESEYGWTVPNFYYTPTENTTLYAHWVEPIEVTFDANGGKISGPLSGEEKVIEKTDSKLTLKGIPPIFFDQGKISVENGDKAFLGWSLEKNANKAEKIELVNESCTLYAIWANYYQVKLDMTEGASENQGQTWRVVEGNSLNAEIPQFSKNPLSNGKYFSGLYTGPNGTGELIKEYKQMKQSDSPMGGSYWDHTDFDFTPKSDTTLYAFWASPIEVNFDANGGQVQLPYIDGAETTYNGNYGYIVKALPPIETKEIEGYRAGYDFVGWSKNQNATEPDVDFVKESCTLYAVWKSKEEQPAKFTYKVLDETGKTAALTGYEGYKKTLEIPESIDGYTIVGIGEDALAYNYYFEKVILPDTIATIGDYAFCSSDSLKEIDLPSSITKIGKGAFDGCNSLESITIPEKVTVIEDGTFYSNSSLKQVNLNSKITRIGNSAFRGCSSLEKLTIPSSVTAIDDAAFFGCDSLKEVTIPASVKSIGTMAFGYHFREGTEQEAKAQENIKRPEFYETHQGGKGDGGPKIYFVFDTYKDFVIKGYSETAAEKYANENKIKFVDLDGKLNGFVKGPDGKWAIYKNNKVDTSATGIFQNENGWWRVENGYVNFKAQGIYQNEYGWWKTTDGKVTFKETGVFQNENGWWRVKDSKVDFKANGIYQNKNGWWKTTNGKVTFKETGVFQNENGWWRVKDSKVDFKANGIYQNQYGWWKTTNGKVTFKENGVFQNEHGWWVVKDSKVDFNATGLYDHGNEIWKATNGKVNFKETGMFRNNDGDMLYRVKNSKVDTKANGIYKYGNDWYKTTNGEVTFDETGLFKGDDGLYYVRDSKVDFDFTGLASNNSGTYYVENGKVNTKKNGKIKLEGQTFTLKNGKVV